MSTWKELLEDAMKECGETPAELEAKFAAAIEKLPENVYSAMRQDARALVREPALLLLDEPFAKLDAALRERMRHWVFALARQQGMPVLLVTHDAADVADAAHLTRLHTV